MKGDEFTSHLFTFQKDGSEELAIPALSPWQYVYKGGRDSEDQVLGIEHSRFENLVDIRGERISPGNTYNIYNAFIDFHVCCNLLAFPTPQGRGIQDLTRIGQKVIHEAAHSKAPIHLGNNIAQGSYFQNGEITLFLEGLSVVDHRPCGLVPFDSGQSSFRAVVQTGPQMEVVTAGSSHYRGEIHKDLQSQWVQKVTFDELVVFQTTAPMMENKISGVVERDILIENVDRESFSTSLAKRGVADLLSWPAA
jgi:hypothetical protein